MLSEHLGKIAVMFFFFHDLKLSAGISDWVLQVVAGVSWDCH